DLHHLREIREATLRDDNGLRDKAEVTKTRELSAIKAADATIVVSEFEKKLLEPVSESKIYFMPLIRTFEGIRIPPFNERSGILFIGGFLHRPNVDAVEYFLDEIWPHVYAADPRISFRVVGSNLPPDLCARQQPGVTFVGYVGNLATELEKAIATVAPLRYGAGSKGKIISSLGHGVPNIASKVAAEGMRLTDGHDIIIADDPNAYVSAIRSLHEDEALWNKLSKNGLDTISSLNSPVEGKRRFRQIFEELGIASR